MRVLRRFVLGLTLLAAATSLTGCAVAQPVPGPYGAGTPAQPPADVPGDWQQDLSPYGNWTTLPNYGTVWYPNVPVGWQPYTYGSWAWGPGGWTWYSTEPWGFTFHYGRWAWAPVGWVWVPGYVWGPAWVNWYWGNGFVGWGPIGFFSAVPFAQFVFISDRDFNCHNVHDVHHHHWNNWGGGNFHHGPPPPDHIQQVARDPIVRVSASELPNRAFPGRGAGRPARAQVPGNTTGVASLGPTERPRGTTQGQARPQGSRQQATLPRGQSPQAMAPRAQSGRDNPRPPASPSNAYRPPQPRTQYASPPSYYATPRTMRPQGNGYGVYNPYPGAPQSVPRAMQPGQGMPSRQGMAPPSQGVPRMSPQGAPRAPSAQSVPRMTPMAPSVQSAPRMAPTAPSMGRSMPSAPTAPAAPAAPSGSGFTGGSRGYGGGGVTGGGRGFGGGGGFSSHGGR